MVIRDKHHPERPGPGDFEMSTKTATKPNAPKAKGSLFGDLGGMMGLGGFDNVLSAAGADAGRPTFAMVKRSEIKLYKQQRDENELESDEQTLDKLRGKDKTLARRVKRSPLRNSRLCGRS